MTIRINKLLSEIGLIEFKEKKLYEKAIIAHHLGISFWNEETDSDSDSESDSPLGHDDHGDDEHHEHHHHPWNTMNSMIKLYITSKFKLL